MPEGHLPAKTEMSNDSGYFNFVIDYESLQNVFKQQFQGLFEVFFNVKQTFMVEFKLQTSITRNLNHVSSE